MRLIDADEVCDKLLLAREIAGLLGADQMTLDRIDGVVALLSDEYLSPSLDGDERCREPSVLQRIIDGLQTCTQLQQEEDTHAHDDNP